MDDMEDERDERHREESEEDTGSRSSPGSGSNLPHDQVSILQSSRMMMTSKWRISQGFSNMICMQTASTQTDELG